MKCVITRNGLGSTIAVHVQFRTILFYLWCIRRAIISFAGNAPWFAELLQEFDDGIVGILLNCAGSDRERAARLVDSIGDAFERFDQSMEDTREPGWVYWLGRAVIYFLHDDVADSDVIREFMHFQVPGCVLIDIHRAAHAVLSRRGLLDDNAPRSLS